MTAKPKERRVLIRSGLGVAAAAIGFIALGATAPAFAQTAACTNNGKISKQIAKQMVAAQEAQKAHKFQEVLTKVREADAVPGAKSQFDTYYMAETRGYAYFSLHQDADAARELENALNSPCMKESAKAGRYRSLVGLYTNLRNYPKAIDYGNRALKLGRDTDTEVLVAQAYYQSGDNKNAVRVMNELLEQKGGVPKEQQLLLVRAACEKVNDNACVSRVYEKLVVNYPKTEYWQALMQSLRKGDTDDIQKLNVMRLAVQVNVMKQAEEYKEMAQLALDEQLAGEAQQVLEQGFEKKIFTDKRDIDVNTRLLTKAKATAATEKAALAKNDAAARAAATGDADVKVGAQYLAFGDPVKAAEAIQRGITKGGIATGDSKQAQRADEARLLLGIAHLRNNNKIEAAKAFKSVKNDPTMVRIAKLWLLNT